MAQATTAGAAAESRCHLHQPRYVISVRDLERTTRYFQEYLGFTVHETGDAGWRFFVRDECVIFAGQHADGPSAKDTGEHSYFAYVVVDDVEALYEEFRRKGVLLTKPLRSENWGMREFGIRTIDGHRMMFGARLQPDER